MISLPVWLHGSMCNRELLRKLLLRDFPPYLAIGAKRGQINFVMSLLMS